MKFREDMWGEAEKAALAAGYSDRTDLITQALTAMLGYIRCPMCDSRGPGAAPVPVEFGDLEGRPLAGWIADAVSVVKRQHPDHDPVRVGAGLAVPAAPAPSSGRLKPPRRVATPPRIPAAEGKAATIDRLRSRIKEAESRPAAAKVVRFVPPPE